MRGEASGLSCTSLANASLFALGPCDLTCTTSTSTGMFVPVSSEDIDVRFATVDTIW